MNKFEHVHVLGVPCVTNDIMSNGHMGTLCEQIDTTENITFLVIRVNG